MTHEWFKNCYEANQFQLWVMNCLTEKQLTNLITKKYKQKSKIELQEKIINQIIVKDDRYSYFYADEVLKRPFPLGEPAIATSAIGAYLYANTVLHGPFPLGEPAIATNAEWSYWYARDVLHGPFSAGEPTIKKDPYWKNEYEELFKVTL